MDTLRIDGKVLKVGQHAVVILDNLHNGASVYKWLKGECQVRITTF